MHLRSALFPQEEKQACMENGTFTRILHGLLAPGAQTYVAGAARRFFFFQVTAQGRAQPAA